MTWIQTYSGVKFDLLRPRAIDVRVVDVAHHLSLLCRWVGATRRFYSVAQHSVLVSQAVCEEFALHGLLHDAHEAYVGDLSMPLKDALRCLGVPFESLEQPIIRAVNAAFDLKWTAAAREVVNRIDRRILVDEAELHLGGALDRWSDRFRPGLRLEGCAQDAWPAELAEREFLRRYDELDRRRQRKDLAGAGGHRE